jgi:bifunctional non-homologous end joining protein LigD
MIAVSNADRIVFPEVKRTKGDVVAYYERIAPRLLVHVVDRPLSIRRFPKGLAAPGFFQKNVPAHYPESIRRLAIPRSKAAAKLHPRRAAKAAKDADEQDVTAYPLIDRPEHLAYLANQGAIELHVPTSRASDLDRLDRLDRPDRVVIDLDPPAGAFDLVRRAALLTRDALAELGLATVPIATGSKGYHVVAAIRPTVDADTLAVTLQKVGALLALKHPDALTAAFRVAARGGRVFIDWLRNRHGATVVAPYSLRARPRATVAVPLSWNEIETTNPDAFTIEDVDRLLDRPDSLASLAEAPSETEPFVAAVDASFERAGLVLEPFDRFRS